MGVAFQSIRAAPEKQLETTDTFFFGQGWSARGKTTTRNKVLKKSEGRGIHGSLGQGSQTEVPLPGEIFKGARE